MQQVCLNLGCGSKLFPSNETTRWINFDCDLPNHDEQFETCEGDARCVAKFFPHGTFDHVLAEFVFEHLTLVEVQDVLFQLWQLLKPGGSMVVMVPDFNRMLSTFNMRCEQGEESFELYTQICTKVFGLDRQTQHKSVWTKAFAQKFLVADNLFEILWVRELDDFDCTTVIDLRRLPK